jgi:NADH pyrophosphatase NudC (nudix superfamily)
MSGLSKDERIERFAAEVRELDVKSVDHRQSESRGQRVVVSIVTPEGKTKWSAKIHDLLELGREYRLTPSEGQLNANGVNVFHFQAAEDWFHRRSGESDEWSFCPNCGSELEEPAGPYNEWTDCPECGEVCIDFHDA